MAALHGGTLVSLIAFSPIYLKVVHGSTPSETGLLLLPMTISIGAASLIIGRMVGRTGYTAIFPSVGLVAVVLPLLFLALFSQHLSAIGIASVLGITSFMMGSVMGVVQVTVQAAAGPARLGTAAASVQFSRALGGAIGTALIGVILFVSVRLIDPDAATRLAGILQGSITVENAAEIAPYANAFRFGFCGMACFAAVGAVLAWTMPLRRI
jgi:predicted MFS family arabinose efflux permease